MFKSKRAVTDTSLFVFIIFYSLFVFVFLIPSIGSTFDVDHETGTVFLPDETIITDFDVSFKLEREPLFLRSNKPDTILYVRNLDLEDIDIDPNYNAVFEFSAERTILYPILNNYYYKMVILCTYESSLENECPQYYGETFDNLNDFSEFNLDSFNIDYEDLDYPRRITALFDENQNELISKYITEIQEYEQTAGGFNLVSIVRTLMTDFRTGIDMLPAMLNIILFSPFVILLIWIGARFLRGN